MVPDGDGGWVRRREGRGQKCGLWMVLSGKVLLSDLDFKSMTVKSVEDELQEDKWRGKETTGVIITVRICSVRTRMVAGVGMDSRGKLDVGGKINSSWGLPSG